MRITFTGDDQGTMCQSLKNPTPPTETFCVRVALTCFPPLMTYQSLVYAPTHRIYKNSMLDRQPTVYTRASVESSAALKQ